LPNAADFKSAVAKTFAVSFSGYADETASLCNWICPDNHYLESWNDHLPKPGHYTLVQPTISPLFETRQWQESLLALERYRHGSYHDLHKAELGCRCFGWSFRAVRGYVGTWPWAMVALMPLVTADEVITYSGSAVRSRCQRCKTGIIGAGEWELSIVYH
jgi:anaerobic selenocysteine-containing dehydrogenase